MLQKVIFIFILFFYLEFSVIFWCFFPTYRLLFFRNWSLFCFGKVGWIQLPQTWGTGRFSFCCWHVFFFVSQLDIFWGLTSVFFSRDLGSTFKEPDWVFRKLLWCWFSTNKTRVFTSKIQRVIRRMKLMFCFANSVVEPLETQVRIGQSQRGTFSKISNFCLVTSEQHNLFKKSDSPLRFFKIKIFLFL